MASMTRLLIPARSIFSIEKAFNRDNDSTAKNSDNLNTVNANYCFSKSGNCVFLEKRQHDIKTPAVMAIIIFHLRKFPPSGLVPDPDLNLQEDLIELRSAIFPRL